jgi:sugar phosphate isomerase/epimerase
MRFGASIWPFKWDPPYEDAIRRIGRLGFRATELISWNRQLFDDYYTPAKIAELRSILDGEGVKLSQFVSTAEDITSADPVVRQACLDHFKKLTDIGAELGSPIVNTVTHYPFAIHVPPMTTRPLVQKFTADYPAGLDWDENYEQYVDAIRQCAEYAGAAGLKYSIEPHPYRYAGNTDGLLRLIERVGSDHFGVNWDPSHLFPAAELPHVSILRLNKRLLHCHFSDNDGLTNVHWRPGEGKIDWPAVMAALKEVGYDDVISLEFEDIPGVSRGKGDAPGVYRHEFATEGFAAEYVVALTWLTELAREAGITVEA